MSRVATSRRRAPTVVGVRELREETSAVVAAVERGDWFLVSKRGRPAAVLLPSAMAENLLLEHAAEIVALQLDPDRARAGRARESRRDPGVPQAASPRRPARRKTVVLGFGN